jgi:hypothetical protein
VAARDAWVSAMRAAKSGRPADLAVLAIAQDAYETAVAEHERWASIPRPPIPVEPEHTADIGTVVGQEVAWRHIHDHDDNGDQPGPLRRLLRRLIDR